MNGKRVLLRVIIVFMLATLCLLLLAATGAQATPIQPDLEKMLQEAQRPVPPYIPARAGWNGPEIRVAGRPSADGFEVPTMETFNNISAVRALRDTFTTVVVPDARAMLGLGAVILLLRKMRSLREAVERPQPQPV